MVGRSVGRSVGRLSVGSRETVSLPPSAPRRYLWSSQKLRSLFNNQFRDSVGESEAGAWVDGRGRGRGGEVVVSHVSSHRIAKAMAQRVLTRHLAMAQCHVWSD